MNTDETLHKPRFSFSFAALLTLVLGLATTVALFVALRSLEHKAQAADFEQRANIRLARVAQGLSDAAACVVEINQLFVTFGSVSREQFHIFTRPFLERYPYIQAFNYHRLVSAAERPVFEARMRAQFPNFALTEMIQGKQVPVSEKTVYNVVDYLEPMAGNEPAFGLDVTNNVQEQEAMEQSIRTGKVASSRLLQLAQGTGERRGFAVLMPVYRAGADLSTAEARRSAVIGDTAAIFSVGALVEKILRSENLFDVSGVNISLYAAGSPVEAELAFRSGDAPVEKTASLIPAWLLYDQVPSVSRTFDLAGRPWHMVVSAQRGALLAGQHGSLYVLIGGVLFSMLAVAYIQALVSRSARVRQMVEERTAEARAANEQLTRDIATRIRTEKELQLRHRAIEASANAIIITSAEAPAYPIEYVNPAFERMTGYSAEEMVGKSMRILCRDDTKQPGIAEFKASTIEQREGHAVIRCYRKDGSLFWNDLYTSPVRDVDGKVTHFVAAQYDITDMKRYEAELEFQANQDTLTGLANRNLLRDRLQQALAYAARYGHPVWVIYVDLDRFKFINDTLGLSAGDTLLKQVAVRLHSCLRETDTVARLAADEFVLVLPERTNENQAIHIIQRIMEAVAKPFTIESHEFFITCSVGMAVYPTDGEDADTLLKHADLAMYRAKETGRNNSQFFTPAMNERALERLRLEGDLRMALEHRQFELHYQPQVDLHNGRIVGMEALIRWQHPLFGMVPPGKFIGLAEETGLIVPIGAWVIRTACKQLKSWQAAGYGDLRVAVNLSARQFAQQDLVESIAAVLKECELTADSLEIELTESLVMTDIERAIRILRDLAALGVQVSIDDFGTGYSSLSYLKRLPLDVMKIDQSFVRDISVDPDDAAIVSTIISLAHSLRLHVIAEGVETAEQLQYLRQHNCDAIQGYYFSRPVPADQFEKLLQEGKSLTVEQSTAYVQ